MALEGLREVALVGEAGVQGDLGKWHLRDGEPRTGEFNSEPSDVFTHGTGVMPAERACEMVSGDSDYCGDLAKGQVLGKTVAKQFACAVEPTRRV